MKAGFYWAYPTRALTRGGQRTLLAVFCIAVGVLAIVALQLVGNMVNNGLTDNIRATNGGDISVSNVFEPFTDQDIHPFFDQLQSQGQVSSYTAVAQNQAEGSDSSGNTQTYTLEAVDPQVFPLEAASVEFVTPNNGSLASLLTGSDVVVTQSLLKTLGAQVGDRIDAHVGTRGVISAHIVGAIKNTALFQGDTMLVSLAYYQGLSDSSNQPIGYPVIYVDVPGHSDAIASTVKTEIKNHLQGAEVTTTQDALQQAKDQVQQIRYFLQVIGLLALLIGGVGIINTMQVLLRRRQTEIAMLKTAGYHRRDLYLLFGVEAGLLGLIGGAVGAAAGVGVSFLVKGLVENAFSISLPAAIDPVTVGSGVAIGFFTALIFGLLPIVQASRIRPIAVLRGLGERATSSAVLSIVLSLLLAVLFFLLALSILQNVAVALGVVVGGGLFLLLLSLAFTLVAFLISKLPVPERLSWWFLLLVVVGLLISAVITAAIPAFGILFLALSLLGVVVVLLPRNWKSNIKMALRNIGRQKTRTSTTMVALFVGIFAIGLILVLGQNIESSINTFIAKTVTYNSFILAGHNDKAKVDQALSQVSGVQKELVNSEALGTPTLINGIPIGQFLQGVDLNGTNGPPPLLYFDGIQGYDLTQGPIANLTVTNGRNLGPQDANSMNVLVSEFTARAPFHLKLNDQITLVSSDKKHTVTVTVVGFYPLSAVNIGLGIYGANSLADMLSGGNSSYIYSLQVDPSQAHQILNHVQKVVPSVSVFNLADLLAGVISLLNNVIVMMTAISSLAMFAGLIIIANAVALAMLERRRELGILKAVGYTSRSVLSEVLMENGVVGFTGAVLAMLLVTLATVVLAKLVFKITLGVSAPIVLGIVLATAVVCMLIAGLVAWSATRVRPLAVLRYE
ncbi:MAG TPA: FtsX-like permease family protein [Ktedonobacterales bacterium]|nr:FtsX-like permease family protein [Ktedonobacterales bacterium]